MNAGKTVGELVLFDKSTLVRAFGEPQLILDWRVWCLSLDDKGDSLAWHVGTSKPASLNSAYVSYFDGWERPLLLVLVTRRRGASFHSPAPPSPWLGGNVSWVISATAPVWDPTPLFAWTNPDSSPPKFDGGPVGAMGGVGGRVMAGQGNHKKHSSRGPWEGRGGEWGGGCGAVGRGQWGLARRGPSNERYLSPAVIQ